MARDYEEPPTNQADQIIFKPHFTLPPGTLLKQRYQIEKQLGTGGMGRVYSAIDIKSSCRVAVKQLLTTLDGENSEIKERFRREYDFLNSIDHVNLVKAIELFEEEGTSFLILEFAEGISLKQLIQEQPRSLSLLEQIAVCNQISRAVEVLNTAGILHRDLKPANIMLNRNNGIVKLLDLGLGKSVGKDEWMLTQKGAILGTWEYLSPEQANGEISERSDVFSLAITLYQFLLWEAHSPFKSQTNVAALMEIMTKELPPLSAQIEQKVKERGWVLQPAEKDAYCDISQLLQLGLAKEPGDRATADKIADDLEMIYQTLKNFGSAPPVANANKKTQGWSITVKASLNQVEQLQQLGKKFGRDELIEKKHKRVSRRISAITNKRSSSAKETISARHYWYATAILTMLSVLGLAVYLANLFQSKEREMNQLRLENQRLREELKMQRGIKNSEGK